MSLNKFDAPWASVSRLRSSVVFRLLVSVILFSSTVTLFLTLFQLYRDYDRGVGIIESRLEDINKSYLGSLGEGLWRLDQQQLHLQLDGILRLSDIRAVEVRETTARGSPMVVTVGQRAAGSVVAREFPIVYRVQGAERLIGVLYVEATLTNLYHQLMNTALVILVSQAAKTFLVSLFIIYIFSRLVTRHLAAIARFVGHYDFRHPPPPFSLQRRPHQKEDELDQMVAAFNAMCARLQQVYCDLREANADLQQENAERRRAEESLREREGRIRRLVESNIIGIFFWDLAGNISDANDAWLQITAYSRSDLLSGKIQWTSMTPPEYLAADARASEELRQAGTCSPYEKEFIRKDGRRIPVLIGGALLEGSQENGVAFVLDLTERKQAEAEREARQAAEAANRAKSAFLANMSHELRTPLNGILGYAQILRRDKTLGERQLAGVDVIRQSGEQLLTLINDILDFAKIEAGKLALSPTDIALAEFLRVIAEMIGVKAEQKGLDFFCDMAPDLPTGIRADEKRLRQALLNLLANAVKFTDRGQVSLRVRFLPPSRLRFEVQDTGIGIRQDQLESIFQPFEQGGEAQRRLGGTGLGLAISRQFVRLMGGEIRLQSQVGQGSTFWFELELPVVETVMAPALSESIVTGYQGPRKKLLVVDDVAENRAVAVDMLRPLGFEMVEAENGCEGLEQAQALRPDLILMDIVMPEMDGLEATRRPRQLPAQKDVPIIAISASASGGDKESSLAAGMNAFLPKPIDFGRLLAQIAVLLRLNWTYELPPAGPAPEQEVSGPLLAPPAQEMAILHRLAREGNMRDIVQHAAHLAELDERYRPFAEQLRLLAQGYQSKAILSLVERYLEKEAGA